MNEQAARSLIKSELDKLRQLAYSELVTMIGNPSTKEVIADDGKWYQLETEVFWDNKRPKDLRVMVAADDGGWRAFKPLTGDFIIRPDGSFVGELLGGY